MKKSILTIATALTLVFTAGSVNAQNGNNDNYLIAKARNAAKDCLSAYNGTGTDIAANVETTGICFVSGELHKVTFYTTVKCHQEPCPRPASVLVATVYFDCDDTVTNVECAN